MGSIGTQELIIILVIVLLLFGAKRIPEIARSMGHGIREFKKATKEIAADVNLAGEGEERQPQRAPGSDPGEPQEHREPQERGGGSSPPA